MIVASMMFWASSSVTATNSEVTRPKVGLSSAYVLRSPSYLPIQVIEEVY
jgi:hypothetical protein